VTKLTERQSDLIVGSLLGDGAMRCKDNALLEINHGFGQRDYVDWKFRELRNLVRTPPKARASNGSRVAYRFTTLSLPALTPYFRAFYPDGRKAIPCVRLSPLAVAVWFMDDGSRSRSSVYLNTQQFDEASHLALADALLAQLGVTSTLNRDKTYLRLRVAVGSIRRFTELVEPHVLPMFRYKLPPAAAGR
jgi:LAGLIDADG DNA endonuclease family